MRLLYAILDFPAVKWAFLVLLLVMPLASLLTWAERRQSAMMQDRLGPNRANIGPFRLWGILHFVADALKMIFKEDFVPARASRILFTLAPIMALAPVLIAFALIPFGPPIDFHKLGHAPTRDEGTRGGAALRGEPMQVFVAEFGLLFYFAIASLANYGATLAGWASYNKWSLLGGLRASSQMMAYEVAMGLAIMGMFLVTGTLEPGGIVAWQTTHTWGVLAQPLAFLPFSTATAETKRAPFARPEGEPEIVGYFVEYSGLRFGMFFLGEFIEVVFAAAILVTVFFGGWDVPFLRYDGWHFGFLGVESIWPHGLVVLVQVIAWTIKVIFFCWLQLLIRWTLPRFRPDQLMRLGWTKLLPLSPANIMITALVILW